MPYSIRKGDGGWFVVNKETGERKNKDPHKSFKKAVRHMRALYVHVKDA